MFKIEGTKSQGCPYCDKCKLVNYKILKDYIIKYNIFIEINCFNLIILEMKYLKNYIYY